MLEDKDKDIRYTQEEAQKRLASIAQILMPLIRKGEASGATWKEIQEDIVTTNDELVCLALQELATLDEPPDAWLANEQVLDFAGLSYDDIACLSDLAATYLHYYATRSRLFLL